MPDKPVKLYIFYCSSSLDAGALVERFDTGGIDTIKTISLPCSGKADVLYLLKAFETGADGVVLVTCPEGECRYLEGNLRAHKRAAAVDSLLMEIGYDSGRMAVFRMGEGGTGEMISKIGAFLDSLRTRAGMDNNRNVPLNDCEKISL